MIKKILLITFFILSITHSQSDTLLIISEVMFSPASGNNEFIEIYNLSATQSVDLNTYKIKYYTSNPDQFTDAGSGTTLLPNTYAIVFENDYDTAAGIYSGLVPANTLILKIADNSFGTSGMANTSSRPLWLLNADNDTVDYYFYSANNATAISDEKKILNRDSLQTNWANSLVTNGTPGFINSVTQLSFDLQLSSLSFSPSNPIQGNDVNIFARLKNNGISQADSYSIEIFNDGNKNLIAEINENIFTQSFSNLLPNDSITITTVLNSLPADLYQIIAVANFADDQNQNNNTLIKQFTVTPQANNFNDVVINEIMYAPSTGEPEWIELYNRTTEVINLKNWKISDAFTAVTITTQDKVIPANSFIIISKDSTILNFYSVPVQIVTTNIASLNNTGDAVVIGDENNINIDSVSYLPSWGGNTGGKSLERIDVNISSTDSTNWRTSKSIFKATPGLINSVTQKEFDLFAGDILFTPKFPLAGDNISIAAFVKNIGKTLAVFSINLYEDTNLDSIPDLLLESLTNLTLLAGDSSSYQFAFSIQNIQIKKGFLTHVLFDQDQDTTNNKFYKTIDIGFPAQTIVINEIMFSPLGGEPEWIELYNNSDAQINLNNWSVSDVITTPVSVSIKNVFVIEPKGFVVLSKDTTIFNYHRFIPSPLLKLNLPSFNNDQDGVVLKDNRGITIDSVRYSNQWGGANGFSLERISTTSNSNNQFNWASSKDIEQSTPGRINSLTPKVNDLSISSISFSPRFPVNGDDISISLKIKNNGSAAAANFIVEFFVDSDSDNTVDLLLSSVTGSNINPEDSLVIFSSSIIQNIQRKILTAAKVNYSLDEDTLNNYFEKSVEPGAAQNIIKINEIMYNPADGETEWIEFVNVSDDSINLKNWFVSDVLTAPTKSLITEIDNYIKPNEIFIIARDSSFNLFHPELTNTKYFVNFGTLGNTSDGVVLYDFRSGVIDSLLYNSKWGNKKGFSLERISLDKQTNDSTNWMTSLDKTRSTPGKVNSVFNLLSFAQNTFIINEIMYAPDNDFSEYVEFLNLSPDSVNIGGWKMLDEQGNAYRLAETLFSVPSGAYFVLIADSSTVIKYGLQNYEYKSVVDAGDFGLSNSGEIILLKDGKANIIDSVFYQDNWNNKNLAVTKGRSLERINPNLNSNEPANWSTAVNSLGGTPGFKNSIFAENLNLQSNISVSPNPFSPDNDGFEDFTIINYNLTQPVAQVRIKIFDSKGRLVRTLVNNQASGSNGSIIFDGLEDESEVMRMGIYIIFLEALNENSGTVETLKTVVVVARKL
jgi:hypothetical protein